MFLPTVSLDPLSGLDRSLNAIKLMKAGTGGFETVLDADGKPIDVRNAGASAYCFDVKGPIQARDFTLEYLGRPATNAWQNVIWSSGNFPAVSNQLLFSVGTSRLVMLRSAGDREPAVIINEWEIPPEKRSGNYAITLTKT